MVYVEQIINVARIASHPSSVLSISTEVKWKEEASNI